jgi:hypothetical protein
VSSELLEPDRATLSVLARAEQEIGLLARLTPTNADAEIARLSAAFARGERLKPEFRYAKAPDLGALRSELNARARTLEGRGALCRLYAERALELELEAQIAEHVGTPGLARLAALRFAAPDSNLAKECDAFVEAALALSEPHDGELHLSDDWSDPKSLCSTLQRRAREADIRVRVEIVRGQLAIATAGDGVVGVRPGVKLSRASAERISVHELFGHAMPRERARHALPQLLRIGSARSSEAEEGRALLLEARGLLMNTTRKRELAFRHLAASATRTGQSFEQTARALSERGARARMAIEIATRAQRGGGLAREIVYLPAWFELRRELDEDPSLEALLERGRLSLAAAKVLAGLG